MAHECIELEVFKDITIAATYRLCNLSSPICVFRSLLNFLNEEAEIRSSLKGSAIVSAICADKPREDCMCMAQNETSYQLRVDLHAVLFTQLTNWMVSRCPLESFCIIRAH